MSTVDVITAGMPGQPGADGPPGPPGADGATSSVFCVAGLANTTHTPLYAFSVPTEYALFPIDTIIEQSGGFSTSGAADGWVGHVPPFNWKLNVPEAGWYQVNVQFAYYSLSFDDTVGYGEVAHWLYAGNGGTGGPASGTLSGQDYILHQRPFFLSVSDDFATFDDSDLSSTPFDDKPQMQMSGVLYLTPTEPLHIEGQYRGASLARSGETHVNPLPHVDSKSFVISLKKIDSGGGSIDGVPHVIQDEGTPLTQRANLNFVGDGVTVTDSSGTNSSVVTIPGGGGGGSSAQYCRVELSTDDDVDMVPSDGGTHPFSFGIPWELYGTMTQQSGGFGMSGSRITVPESGLWRVSAQFYPVPGTGNANAADADYIPEANYARTTTYIASALEYYGQDLTWFVTARDDFFVAYPGPGHASAVGHAVSGVIQADTYVDIQHTWFCVNEPTITPIAATWMLTSSARIVVELVAPATFV